MMNKYCPECYTELEDNETVCPNCGYVFTQTIDTKHPAKTDSLPLVQGKIKQGKERAAETPSGVEVASSSEAESNQLYDNIYLPILRRFIIALALIFFVVSGIFFYKAYDVKTNYYNSEDFYSLNENAYVGGDAYNYIINGTYFTGYSVIASAFLISGILLVTCNMKTREHFEGEKK